MIKKQKLLLGSVVVLVIFFVITFSKNWGTAVSENLLEKYKPEVKQLKSNPAMAMERCPAIIKKIENGLPELAKSKDSSLVPKAQKLIADCAFASHDFAKAKEFYKILSNFEPNVATWHHLIAESAVRMNEPAEALQPSILSAQLDPGNYENKLLTARIMAKLELYNRAVNAYAQAIKVAPYEKISATKQELEAYIAQHSEAKPLSSEESP